MKISRRSFLKVAGVSALASAVTGSVAGCGGGPVTLTYAEVNPETTIVGKIGAAFKAKLEELSEGKVLVDFQASGVLGSETAVLDTMLAKGSTIDVARISAFALNTKGTKKNKVLSLPYVFTSREHFWAFAASDLAKEVMAEPAELGLGVQTLMLGEEGFRHFFTTDKITGVDGLKNKKLRVSNDPIMNGLVEALGGIPAVVDWGELYTGLESGVCDGAEQPIVNYEANSFQDVSPNLLLNGHTLGAVQIIVTDEAMKKLTEEQQQMVRDAAVYAGEQNAKVAAEDEAAVLEQLRADGINVIDNVDMAALVEVTKPVVEANLEDDAARAMYEAIAALA